MSFFDLFPFKKKANQREDTSDKPSLLAKALQEEVSANTSSVVFHRRIDPDENIQAPKGAALTYLDARALEFWGGKRTDYKIPPYYSESAFGRNVGPALTRLLQGKYLQISELEKTFP